MKNIKLKASKHKGLNAWILKMAKMCGPKNIVWIDGSEEQKKIITILEKLFLPIKVQFYSTLKFVKYVRKIKKIP